MNLHLVMVMLAPSSILTLWTVAIERHPLSYSLIARPFRRLEFQPFKAPVNVHNGMTAQAIEVMVIIGIRVIAGPIIAQTLYRAQLTQRDELVQRVVDRGARYVRQLIQDALVDLICRRMGFVIDQQLEYDPALGRDPEAVSMEAFDCSLN